MTPFDYVFVFVVAAAVVNTLFGVTDWLARIGTSMLLLVLIIEIITDASQK